MTPLVIMAGLGQLALAAGSLAIPRILNWRSETVKLSPLTRSVFWTYAGYIWGTNVCFGLLSTFAPSWLLDGSPLARAVSGFEHLHFVFQGQVVGFLREGCKLRRFAHAPVAGVKISAPLR